MKFFRGLKLLGQYCRNAGEITYGTTPHGSPAHPSACESTSPGILCPAKGCGWESTSGEKGRGTKNYMTSVGSCLVRGTEHPRASPDRLGPVSERVCSSASDVASGESRQRPGQYRLSADCRVLGVGFHIDEVSADGSSSGEAVQSGGPGSECPGSTYRFLYPQPATWHPLIVEKKKILVEFYAKGGGSLVHLATPSPNTPIFNRAASSVTAWANSPNPGGAALAIAAMS